jgi:hypothetical protein
MCRTVGERKQTSPPFLLVVTSLCKRLGFSLEAGWNTREGTGSTGYATSEEGKNKKKIGFHRPLLSSPSLLSFVSSHHQKKCSLVQLVGAVWRYRDHDSPALGAPAADAVVALAARAVVLRRANATAVVVAVRGAAAALHGTVLGTQQALAVDAADRLPWNARPATVARPRDDGRRRRRRAAPTTVRIATSRAGAARAAAAAGEVLREEGAQRAALRAVQPSRHSDGGGQHDGEQENAGGGHGFCDNKQRKQWRV